VVGSEPGSKAQEAQRLKVTLLSEAEFTQLVAR
jgi:NAD-dependent DNA ligase